MKKKLLIIALFIGLGNLYSQETPTDDIKTKVKTYYLAAESYYEKEEYSKVLDKIIEIETFYNLPIATLKNLKVKTLIKLKQYKKAKVELEILYTLNPDGNILSELSDHLIAIDEGLAGN
tara:strand:- start:2483 stop:2842 length:360 start_codon:yes stop_codon:yes gene_type:complete